MGRPSTGWSAPGVDLAAVTRWAPVAAVVAATTVGLGLEHPWDGSPATLVLSGVLLATPLAWRSAWPLAAAAGVALALPLQQALGGTLGFGTFVAVLVASYALGRRLRPRQAAAGAVILLGGVIAGMRHALPHDAEELVFPVFYVSATVVLGGVVRRLVRQAAQLRRLNEALAREREATARLAVATERVRLARDLHDVVAHTLTVAVIQAETCEESITDDPARARSAAREIQQAGRRGLADLRSMVRVLRDADGGQQQPGMGDVETLAAVMSAAGLDVVVRRDGDLAACPAALGRELFLVVQEALTNVVKHSAATSVLVELHRAPDATTTVTVTDPGPALGTDLPSGVHGLAGMAERLAPYAGTVTAGPDGAGFLVRVVVPSQRQDVVR